MSGMAAIRRLGSAGRPGPNRDSVVKQDKRGSRRAGIPELEWQDLLIGVFVAAVIVVGPGLGETMRALAAGIIVVQMLFELPMALLAVAAGQAARVATRVARISLLVLGTFAVIAGGVGYALEFDVLLIALPGVFAVISRTRRSDAGQVRYSAEHCRTVERVAGVSWGWLVLMILCATTFAGISSQPISLAVTADAINWFGAAFWLVYYAGLSYVVPAARRGRLPWLEGGDPGQRSGALSGQRRSRSGRR
jgi:hypothetical protein